MSGGSRPGNDTRQWVSIGEVKADDAGQVVSFREDLGQPLVSVLLHPTETPVYCRVGSMVAGNGEGEWHPFVQGDEVLVAIPEGMEDSGCVIISRLNNGFDKFPMDSVAGQDPTTNTFAFSRRRTPFVQEYAGPVLLRSALSSALITIDETGNITLKDSQNAALQLSADVIGFQGPSDATAGTSPEFLLQLDLTHRHLNVQVGDAAFVLSASDASPEQNQIIVPGAFSMQTIGNPALEHVATTESTANVLEKMFVELAAIIGATGVGTGAAIGAAILAWVATPAFAGVWGAAAAAPIGNVATSLPSTIAGLFAATSPKPQGATSQLLPGIGCPGFFAG